MRYQILYKCIIYSKERVCLCTKETQSGGSGIALSEEKAQARVNELKAIGIDAWYETFDHAWFDD